MIFFFLFFFFFFNFCNLAKSYVLLEISLDVRIQVEPTGASISDIDEFRRKRTVLPQTLKFPIFVVVRFPRIDKDKHKSQSICPILS